MTKAERSWHLTPSQQTLFAAIHARLSSIQGAHRPFLLTGDVGVGKSFLVATLGDSGATCYHVATDYFPRLLIDHSLSSLTPEATVRFAKESIEESRSHYVVIDGFEPLLSLWVVQQANVLPNFFVAFGRAVLDKPVLVVIQTSSQLPHSEIEHADWWPWERRFRLELTLNDKEMVAVNWGLDPMRAQTSANLYDLLAVRLGR